MLEKICTAVSIICSIFSVITFLEGVRLSFRYRTTKKGKGDFFVSAILFIFSLYFFLILKFG